MPLYEFECRACHKRFELLVRTSDEPARCPACGEEDPRRLLSTFSAGRSDGEGAASHPAGACSCCPSRRSCPGGGS